MSGHVSWMQYEELDARAVAAGTVMPDGGVFGSPGLVFSGDFCTAIEVGDRGFCSDDLRRLADELDALDLAAGDFLAGIQTQKGQ